MESITVLAFVGMLAVADSGDRPVPPCLQANRNADNAALISIPLTPVPASDPLAASGTEGPVQPPLPPRGAWWYGERVPYVYQGQIYYPTWDTPLRLLAGLRPLGRPAYDVPQREATPAYWKPPNR
jgi:hypothetical protein